MRSLTLAAVLCMDSSPANTVRIPVFGADCHVQLIFYWDEILRQASLELVSYTYDTFLFERRKLRKSMLLCT